MLVGSVMNLIGQILALEGHRKDVKSGFPGFARLSGFSAQLLLDILYYFGRGGGGQGQDRCFRTDFADVDDFQIGRTEVVAPLGDAMCLVDSDEAYRHVA